VLQYVAVRVAVCCSVLQCLEPHGAGSANGIAVRWSMLEFVGSVLKRVVVCCSVLQCAAVCCSAWNLTALAVPIALQTIA